MTLPFIELKYFILVIQYYRNVNIDFALRVYDLTYINS